MAAHLLRLGALVVMLSGMAWAADPPLKPPAGTQESAEVKKLQDEIKQLQDKNKELLKQLDPEGHNRVSRCDLSGQVDNDTARLRIELVLVTSRPRVQVPIACQKAWASSATLPKGCLLLPAPPGEEGFVVQVEEPGNHAVILDVEVPVTTRGAKGTERGFELGLPRAAITRLLHLDMPPAVREARITGRPPVPSKELSSKGPGRQPLAIGAVDRLEVTWRGPAPVQPDPLLASQAQVEVRVDETYVTAEAELTLSLLRGQTAQWQVQLPPPPQATLEVDEPTSDRVSVTPPAANAKVPVWTIQLKEPSAEPVKVRLRHLQARGKGPVPIGPFAVLGAVRQQGTILVSAAPSVRLRSPPRLRGAISGREPTEEQRKLPNLAAAFGYWSLPVPADPKQPVPAPLELEVETVKGAVETSVNHRLRLALAGWQVTTEIDVVPVRTEVEQLEVELPPYDLKASPLILVEQDLEVKEQAGRRIGVIKLARAQSQKFQVRLEGMCEAGDPRMMTLPLARPVGTQDSGGRVSVSVPEGFELVIARDTGQQTLPADRHELNWRAEHAPAKVELAWHEQRAELPVDLLLDLTVTEWQVRVRQHLRFHFGPDPLKQVVLLAAEGPRELAPLGINATLTRQELPVQSWIAALTGSELTIDYSFPLSPAPPGQRSRRVRIPLLRPELATELRTKVRVWSDPNLQPILASGGGWQELPLEQVPERDALPVLVVQGSGSEPLSLTLTEPIAPPLPQVAVDRTLIQATTADGGHQIYRARFLIQKIASRWIDVALPATPASLHLEVFLHGKRLNNLKVVDEEGREAELGQIVRLAVEPELYREPVVLEIRYQLPSPEGGGAWQTRFLPPRLRGNIFTGRVRWQLDLPPDWVVFATGRSAWAEQSWGLRGALLGPRPAASAEDVERWFGVHDPPQDGTGRRWDLVAWQADLQPLAVYHASQQLWLLSCSLTILALGLALSFAPLPRRLFWAIMALVGLSVVAASVFWPQTLAVIAYGAEPGVLVLLLVVMLQWLFQRRYRRQVVFMPGFTRLTTGSSLLKHGSSHRPRSEPSTVDAPVGSIPELGGSRYGVPKP